MGSPREAGSEHGPLAHFFSVLGDNKIGERMGNKGLLKGRSVYICMWTLMHTPLCVPSGFWFFLGGRGGLVCGASEEEHYYIAFVVTSGCVSIFVYMFARGCGAL